jgi:hypothetical protein
MVKRIEQMPFELTENRECGSCTACCVWLGIEELKKYTGEKCKHLRGLSYTDKRCSIQSSKPVACSTYNCMWKSGWGLDDWQPKRCGILITPYQNDDGTVSFTVTIFDHDKATPYIDPISNQLLMLPMTKEIRVISPRTKKALLYRDGNVYSCRLMPAKGYEELTFAADDQPIGHYKFEKE